METTIRTLQEKLRSSETSQSDKIEKSLIKSLIIGYIVSSNQNDKSQILKMISSILNFDQTEYNKVGLNRNQSGWLSGLLHGAAGASGGIGSLETTKSTGDGLVKAFVDFLEKESQPHGSSATMPNLLNIVSSSATSSSVAAADNSSNNNNSNNIRNERKLSTSSTSSSSAATASAAVTTSHYSHIQPILLNESVLEQFAPTRNSSSILKDILNNDI